MKLNYCRVGLKLAKIKKKGIEKRMIGKQRFQFSFGLDPRQVRRNQGQIISKARVDNAEQFDRVDPC